jgi:penicillin-binding protein 1C
VRTALAGSLNVPAVRMLGLVGPEAFVLQLRRLGFGSLDEDGDFYGPALALGSADVSLWDLVNAYRALANGGVLSPLRLTREDAATAEPRRVYSVEAAFLVAHVLADRESRSVTFGLDNPLATRFWTAVKTGTSRDMRDNWCVGFSSRYTVGVWVGNFAGEPMRDVSGIAGAAPVWRELMEWLHRRVPSPPPAAPAGAVGGVVAGADGTGAGSTEWFLRGTEPASHPAPPLVAADAQARIVAPVSRTVIALDPDMPPARQRVVFEAAGGTARLRWRLGDKDLGPADRLVVWAPRPGRHALALVDGEDRTVDRVTFEVRGLERSSVHGDVRGSAAAPDY